MIRYRCPHCALLTAAHERRVGHASVCKACLAPHQIPTDAALWLTEAGEPLHPAVEPARAGPLAAAGPPEPGAEAVVDRPPAAPEVPEPQAVQPAPVEPPREPEPFREPVPEVLPAARALEPAVRPSWNVPAGPAEGQPGSVATATPPPLAHVGPPRFEPPREPDPFREPAPEVLATVRALEPAVRPSRNAPGGPAAGESGGVATATPPPLVRAPVPRRGPRVAGGASAYGEPVQLQTQADIAVALTAALTSRMKPPAAPRRDLRPSTAAWMLLTGLGGALVLVSLFTDLNYRWLAAAVGATQIGLGYAWIVRLTYLRDPGRGRLCAVPVLTPFYLTQPKYARLRPLRFVLTGAALGGLALLAPSLADLTRPLVARGEPRPPPPDVATQSKLVQLRTYRERREDRNLTKLLEVLVKTDTIRSVDARDRADLAAELEALCKHEDREVRLEAMSAFVSWDLDPNAARARRVCLDAARSPSEDERVRALLLLPRWKDPEAARTVQSLIGRPGRQTNQAKAALEEIGGPAAEQAALALLTRADDQTTRFIAIGILVKVGGAAAAAELSRYAMSVDDPPVRNSALAAAKAIGERTRPQAP